jgi:hypothetical protein
VGTQIKNTLYPESNVARAYFWNSSPKTPSPPSASSPPPPPSLQVLLLLSLPPLFSPLIFFPIILSPFYILSSPSSG